MLSTDYTLESLDFNRMIYMENFLETISDMEKESEIIIESYQTGRILLEADGQETAVNDSFVEKKKGLIKTLLEFIRYIFGKFIEKAKSLGKSIAELLSKIGKKIRGSFKEHLELNMLPYWNMNDEKITSTMDNIVTKTINYIKTNNGKVTEEEIYDKVLSEYVDKEGSFVNGLKNYFRVGNAKETLYKETIKGDKDIAEKVENEFIPYLNNYSSKTVKTLESTANKLTSKIKGLNIVVKENFSLVEGTVLTESSIGFLPNLDKILEAPVTNDETKDNKVGKGVEVKIDENEKEKEEEKKKKENTDKDGNKKSNPLKAMDILLKITQNTITCAMTIAEEKLMAYYKALQLLSTKKEGDSTEIDNATEKVDKVQARKNKEKEKEEKKQQKKEQKEEKKKLGKRLKDRYKQWKDEKK